MGKVCAMDINKVKWYDQSISFARSFHPNIILFACLCFIVCHYILLTVYAIEGSALAKQTRLVVEENKMADRITVLQGRAEVW